MGAPSIPPSKTFTLAEANALLPTVKPLVEQLQTLHQSILRANQQLSELTQKVSAGNGYPIQALTQEIRRLTDDHLRLVERFESALQQLEALGCMLKDLTIGLLDFYGLRDGQTILLCWKLGEERIRFWHTLEEGYPGRQPLDADVIS